MNANTQLSLFDTITPTFPSVEEAYRLTDPETSREAAQDIAPHASGSRLLALRTHAQHPEGLTDFELADLTGVKQTSIGKRRKELMDCELMGTPYPLIEMVMDETGKQPLKRPSCPGGSLAIVWRITEAGLNYLKEIERER